MTIKGGFVLPSERGEMVKIVPDLIDEIAESIKILCDNQLDKMAIYNIFLARFSSVVGSKNILTNSCRHVKPYPIAYYGLNLLSSGGNKNKPLTAINKIFSWIDNEYEEKNNEIKEKILNSLISKNSKLSEKKQKSRDELEQKANDFLKLKSMVNGANMQKIYAICEQIVKSDFGSLFFYETEFIKKFENKINNKTNDDVIDMIYNLYDGEPDYTDTVMFDRSKIENISCNVCFASDYSRLLKNKKTDKEFRAYLQDGFSRRIFLYTSQKINSLLNDVNMPEIDEIQTAKNKLVDYSKTLRAIYDCINEGTIYEYSAEANKLIHKYNKEKEDKIKQKFSYSEIINNDDEILKVDLKGSTWKIVKLSFLFNFIQYPYQKEVREDSVQLAINYYNEFYKHLETFLKRKSLDEFDEYKVFIYKNLDREMTFNDEFRKGLNIHHNKWVEFGKTTLKDLINELAEENIFVYQGKIGRKDSIMFYRKENKDA